MCISLITKNTLKSRRGHAIPASLPHAFPICLWVAATSPTPGLLAA